MLSSIQLNAASVLALAVAVSAAPLNILNKVVLSERSVGLGWLCHFDGPLVPSVDASLNLPLMLGGLCAKVNYDYDGCNSFKPHATGSPVNAQSIPQDYDSSDASKPTHTNHGKKPKHRVDGSNGPISTQSFDAADGDESTDPSSDVKGSSHHKKPKHHGQHNSGTVGAQSFNDAGNKDKPKKDHPSSVNALGNPSDGPNDCSQNEYYSSQLKKCVNKSYFSKTKPDSTCKNGKLDAVLHLCLDVSLLGLTKPIHAEASVLPFGRGHNGKDACRAGQQLSSLLNVCVDQKFFSDPLADNRCEHGWKLDLVLGICLDLVGCQNQGPNNY